MTIKRVGRYRVARIRGNRACSEITAQPRSVVDSDDMTSSEGLSDSTQPKPSPDWVYRLASTLALVEGFIVASLALFLITNSFISEVEAPSAWLAEIAFAALGSAGLIVASRGLRQRKNWGRAPVVLANLIAIPVAYYLITSDRIILGIILGLIAIPALLATWFSIPE